MLGKHQDGLQVLGLEELLKNKAVDPGMMKTVVSIESNSVMENCSTLKKSLAGKEWFQQICQNFKRMKTSRGKGNFQKLGKEQTTQANHMKME